MVVYNGKPYEQMDDVGGKTPLFLVQHPLEDEAMKITWSKKSPDDLGATCMSRVQEVIGSFRWSDQWVSLP